MKMNCFRILTLLAIVSVANFAMGAGYYELLSWDEIAGTGTSQYAHVIDGTTSYHAFSNGGYPCITKIENIDSDTPTKSILVDSTAWATASGATSLPAMNGFGFSGSDLMWTDSSSDAIWKADTTTGAITQYASTADIMAATGLTSASCLSSYTIDCNGEVVFYEGDSDSILKTNGAGSVSVLVSDVELTAAFGSDKVSGGITCLPDGTLLWGNSDNDSICGLAADGTTLFVALDKADLIAFTGETAAGFGDIFFAPDGMVYAYESTSDSILKASPLDPAGTLEMVVSEAELLAGPMASDNVVTLGWYDGNITFHTYKDSGLMTVPEPSTIVLLVMGLGALLVWRRK